MEIEKKYSLILMSDDNSIKKIRMGKKTIRILTIFFILCPLLLALSIWYNIQSFQKMQLVRYTYNHQQQEVSDLKLKLERLTSLNSMLEKYDNEFLADNIKQSPNFILAENKAATNNLNNSTQTSPTAKGSENNKNGTNGSNSENANNQVENKVENIVETNAPSVELVLDAPSGPIQESTPVANENISNTSDLDMNLAKIERIKANKESDTNLSLGFDLVNTGQKSQLEGTIKLYLIDDKENIVPLTATARELSYRINRLKKVSVNAKLANGKISDNQKLMIEINNPPEGVIYRQVVNIE